MSMNPAAADDQNWLARYRRINDRHAEKLLFRLGAQASRAGFFSEINNMLLAVLYCLKSNVRFVLSSGGGRHDAQEAWTDYFVPSFDEWSDPFERRLNVRPFWKERAPIRRRVGSALYKQVAGIAYLTQDVWYEIRDTRMETYMFDCAELGIEGRLPQAGEALIQHVWRFNDRTTAEVAAASSHLRLPDQYVGLHVRRGDKQVEKPPVALDRYVERLMEATDTRNVFLATDDFSIVEAFERDVRQCTVFTLCTPAQRGYWQPVFLAKPPEQRRADTVQLLAEIEMLRRAPTFVGTFSSNIGMFVGMSRGGKECYGVDFDEWRIW